MASSSKLQSRKASRIASLKKCAREIGARNMEAYAEEFRLRSSLIRLAYQNPGLRPHLLPILKEADSSGSFEEAVKGKKFRNPNTGNDVVFGSLPAEEQKKLRSQWESKNKGEKGKAKDTGDAAAAKSSKPAYRPVMATPEMIDKYIDREIESMDGDRKLKSKVPAKLKKQIKTDAKAFEDATHKELTGWVKANKDKLNMDAPGLKGAPDNKIADVLMSAEGGMTYALMDSIEGGGVSLQDGEWDDFFKDSDDLEELEEYLMGKLTKAQGKLMDSIRDAAYSVVPEEDDD